MGTSLLGLGDQGYATLVRGSVKQEHFELYRGSKWLPCAIEQLPESFRKILKLSRSAAKLASSIEPEVADSTTIAGAHQSVSMSTRSLPQSSEWVDIDFAPYTQRSSDFVASVDINSGDLAIYDTKRVICTSIRGRAVSSFPNGRRLDFVRILDSENVIGRNPAYRVLPEYEKYGVWSSDPWIRTELFVLNVKSGKAKSSGMGLYAIPMRVRK
jgi:hypothetical protein